MNTKPFQHKLTSDLECDPKDFPRLAFHALVDFADLQLCQHLLWKMQKYAMCAESYMEGEERSELYQFYEKMHDVLEAVYLLKS
jgi:hypothetical protein